MLDVFLSSVQNNSDLDVPKTSVNVMRGCAVLGFVPSPEDHRTLFAAALSQGVGGFTVERGTSTLIDDVFTAIKILAIETPGGMDALLKYQQHYVKGCEVLLEALLLLPPSKVRASNVANILRLAADIATSPMPLVPAGLVSRYAPRLCELFDKVQRRTDVDSSIVLCEGIVTLNMRDLSPIVVKSCELVARSLHNNRSKVSEDMLQQLRGKRKAALWDIHCWLQEGGYKKQIFTPEALMVFKNCSNGLKRYLAKRSAAALSRK
jgi:hypothetical protein